MVDLRHHGGEAAIKCLKFYSREYVRGIPGDGVVKVPGIAVLFEFWLTRYVTTFEERKTQEKSW